MSARVLILEDDPERLDRLMAVLAPRGDTVIHPSAAELTVGLPQGPWDIIVCSEVGPAVNDPMILAQLLGRPKESRLVLIVDPEGGSQDLRLGAALQLSQTFQAADLQGHLDAWGEGAGGAPGLGTHMVPRPRPPSRLRPATMIMPVITADSASSLGPMPVPIPIMGPTAGWSTPSPSGTAGSLGVSSEGGELTPPTAEDALELEELVPVDGVSSPDALVLEELIEPDPTLQDGEEAPRGEVPETSHDPASVSTTTGEDAGSQEQVLDLTEVLESPEARYEEGRQHLIRGDGQAARRCMQDLVELVPGEPTYRVALAAALLMEGEGGPDLARQRAAVCLQQALQLDPGHVEANLHLGSLYIEVGQWQDAEGCLARVLQRAPAEPRAEALLARMQELRGAAPGQDDEILDAPVPKQLAARCRASDGREFFGMSVAVGREAVIMTAAEVVHQGDELLVEARVPPSGSVPLKVVVRWVNPGEGGPENARFGARIVQGHPRWDTFVAEAAG